MRIALAQDRSCFEQEGCMVFTSPTCSYGPESKVKLGLLLSDQIFSRKIIENKACYVHEVKLKVLSKEISPHCWTPKQSKHKKSEKKCKEQSFLFQWGPYRITKSIAPTVPDKLKTLHKCLQGKQNQQQDYTGSRESTQHNKIGNYILLGVEDTRDSLNTTVHCHN